MTATPQGSTGPGACARGSSRRSPPCASAARGRTEPNLASSWGFSGGRRPGPPARGASVGRCPSLTALHPEAGPVSRGAAPARVGHLGSLGREPGTRGAADTHVLIARPRPRPTGATRREPRAATVLPDSRGVRSPASRDPPEPSPRRGGVPRNRVGAGSGATSFASKSPLSTEFAERVENDDGDDNPRRDERPRPCAERLRLPGSRSRKVSGAVPRPPTADGQPGPRGRGLGRRGRHTPTLSPATAGVLGPGRRRRGRPGLRV